MGRSDDHHPRRRAFVSIRFIAAFAWAILASQCSLGTSPGPLGPRLVDLLVVNRSLVVVYCDVPNESWIDSYDPQTGSLRWRAHFPDAALVGGLVVCRDLLCAPAFVDGIYILDLRSGAQKAHLRTGTDGTEPKVGCTRTRLLVVNGGNKWTADRIWRRLTQRPSRQRGDAVSRAPMSGRLPPQRKHSGCCSQGHSARAEPAASPLRNGSAERGGWARHYAQAGRTAGYLWRHPEESAGSGAQMVNQTAEKKRGRASAAYER